MDDELKPCPFCGGKVYSCYKQNDGDYWSVFCSHCPALFMLERDGVLDGPEEMQVALAWNTRAAMHSQVSDSGGEWEFFSEPSYFDMYVVHQK